MNSRMKEKVIEIVIQNNIFKTVLLPLLLARDKKKSEIWLNLRRKIIPINKTSIIKSIIRSKMIVPKSWLIGIFSTWLSDVHLVISPALGIAILVKYPTAVAWMLLALELECPKDFSNKFHRIPLLIIAKAPNRIDKNTQLNFTFNRFFKSSRGSWFLKARTSHIPPIVRKRRYFNILINTVPFCMQ